MGELTHTQGMAHNTRKQRAERGKCPICGESYDTANRVRNEDSGVLGLAYVHGEIECIEWPSGVTQQYDTQREAIIQ